MSEYLWQPPRPKDHVGPWNPLRCRIPHPLSESPKNCECAMCTHGMPEEELRDLQVHNAMESVIERIVNRIELESSKNTGSPRHMALERCRNYLQRAQREFGFRRSPPPDEPKQ